MSVPKSIAGVVVLLVAVAACGTGADTGTDPEAEPTTTTTAAAEAEDVATTTTAVETTTTIGAAAAIEFVTLVNNGAIATKVDSPEGGVSGELLDLGLTNTTDDPIEVNIPCGLVFVPDSYVEPPGPGDEPSGEQRMMNLSPISVTLGPGQSIIVTPYVMCIDSSNSAPAAGAEYTVGVLAGGHLLALAECICDQDLLAEVGPMGDIEIQMAVWVAADGTLPDTELTEAEGALREVMGGELDIDPDALDALSELEGVDLSGIDLSALGLEDFDLEAMLEQARSFLETYSEGVEGILDQCDITLDQ